MDALEQTYQEISAEANALGFEVSTIGRRSVSPVDGEGDDGRLIKVWPIDARPDVFLELEQKSDNVCIYRHRTSELTRKYQVRAISSDWVIGFMRANETLARARTKLAQEHTLEQKKVLAEELERRLSVPIESQIDELRLREVERLRNKVPLVISRCNVCEEPSIPGDNVCYRHIGE